MCLTELKKRETSGALHITCTMPCLEVGTVGGGTILSPQRSCLEVSHSNMYGKFRNDIVCESTFEIHMSQKF